MAQSLRLHSQRMWVVFIGFVLLCSPQAASGQGRWWSAYLERGFTGGPGGGAIVSEVGAEVGLKEGLRASARYIDRSRDSCSTDSSCPAAATGVEVGLGLSLGGTWRLVPFSQFLVGYSREANLRTGGSRPFLSMSMGLGVYLRVAPPLSLRIAVIHREVPKASDGWDPNERNTGLFIGFGVSGGIARPGSERVNGP